MRFLTGIYPVHGFLNTISEVSKKTLRIKLNKLRHCSYLKLTNLSLVRDYRELSTKEFS